MTAPETIIARLLELPAAIAAAETRLLNAQGYIAFQKERLADEESQLLLADPPVIKGSNEAQRKAHLHQLTEVKRADVTERERTAGLERIALTALQNEFSALRAVARLLAGGAA